LLTLEIDKYMKYKKEMKINEIWNF
jgi:hypothetical protein